MIAHLRSYLDERVVWNRGINPSYPFEAEFDSDRLVIRLNDFPEGSLYTLMVNDEEVLSFDDWPELWPRP
jgi:hypothetical protein